MFKKYKFDIDLATDAFDNLKYRDRTTLILCRDRDGKFILGTKAGYYPDGIVRMLGGGVNKEEEVVDGAIREIKEEIGIDATKEELIELAQIDVTGKFEDKIYKTSIFVYFLNSDKDDYLAGDDVTDVVRYSETEFRDLIKRFSEIRPGPWQDFGKVYGFVHQVTLDEFLKI